MDDGSIIHSKLEQSANDVLTYWVSLILLSISCIVIVMSHSVSNMSITTDLVIIFYTCRVLHILQWVQCDLDRVWAEV